MKVFFSDKAEAGLEHIGDYIARDNPHRALTFIQELRAAASNLGDFARAFPLVSRYQHRGIHRFPYRNYLIFYHVEDDKVAIIHILHGAQDYDQDF